ncbi:MAG TPA: VanW family protein [Candidatus Binatia bacterium]|jgi:vancomycin resistance protein YoaR|nr:VanW family protein [Candidatus Binatia bacterium]
MQIRSTADNPLTLPQDAARARGLRWFLVPPVTALALLLLAAAIVVVGYESRHQGLIYTGVRVWGVDLSRMSPGEAQQSLQRLLSADSEHTITLVDPLGEQQWQYTPAQLGISYDLERTVQAAFDVGRRGGPFSALRDRFTAWYFGRELAPVIVFDEGALERALQEVADSINRPARDAALTRTGGRFQYTPGQVGRQLDISDLNERLLQPAMNLRNARVELLVHESQPNVLDDPQVAARVQAILGSPMEFYFQDPLEDLDLDRVEVSSAQLSEWLRVQMVENNGKRQYDVFIDENAVREWLTEIEAQVFRRPENARFYFDDNTRELVLVEPHVNGRALDVDATLQAFMAQVGTPNRSVPFVVDEIVPTVNSNATAQQLGITELITQSTTWFYGSTPERKHNIARAAAQFFGIVVAPGEEFSFNRYLGDVTEEAGFTTGLIILGGRTVKGVGGGVCQVSTTMYQTAFWSGFPITERLEHGYRVHYYDDGEGPGMDATVFSPLVDLKFVNNTDYYLLIENYYDETSESLTFKFYSTDVGRRVEKDAPVFENETPPKPDVWEYNEDLEPGEIVQVDWAVEGARVTVNRRVYDAAGNLMYGNESFVSNYIPWSNVYQYGPGVDPESIDPDELQELLGQ